MPSSGGRRLRETARTSCSAARTGSSARPTIPVAPKTATFTPRRRSDAGSNAGSPRGAGSTARARRGPSARVEAADPRAQQHRISLHLLEGDASAAPPDEQTTQDGMASRGQGRRDLRLDRPQRKDDRASAQDPDVHAAVVLPDRDQAAPEPRELGPVPRREAPRAFRRALHDRAVGVIRARTRFAVGRDPSVRPSLQLGSPSRDSSLRPRARRVATNVEPPSRLAPLSLRDSAALAAMPRGGSTGSILSSLFASNGLARPRLAAATSDRLRSTSRRRWQLLANPSALASHSSSSGVRRRPVLGGRSRAPLAASDPRLVRDCIALVRGRCVHLSRPRGEEDRAPREPLVVETEAPSAPANAECFAARAPV